ncbi:hypothetical protein ACWFR1_14065 [Streptomyces sp. NPDC055103]
MLLTTPRGARLRLALCTVALLSITSCATDVTLSSLSDSEAAGKWQEGNGGIVELRKNRTFTTSGINWRNVSEGSDCPQAETTTGTWAFWGSDPDHPQSSAALAQYTAGDTINLSFEGSPQGQCLINLNVTKSGSTLCVSDDIEIPCSREVTFTKDGERTAP